MLPDLFSNLDPEVVHRVTCSRREAMFKAAKAGVGVAVLSSLPVAFGLSAQKAFGQSLPQQIVDALNFALTLEYLEDEFYRTALNTSGLIPSNQRPIFETISAHEAAHVAALRSTLGSAAVAKPTFDFTASGTYANVFSSNATFLTLSQAFEDTGERAYKGQAPNLMSSDAVLTIGLQIHAVEARHAAQVRRLRGEKGWKTSNDGPVAAIYVGEQNTTQGGVALGSVTSGYSAATLSEAFDEPLTKAAVLAIVDPFIV